MVDASLPVVERHEIPLLPHQAGLSGITIAHLSDIHIGPLMRQRRVEALVSQVNDLAADIVAVTGDIMNWQRRYLSHAVEPFRHLKSRLGSFAILGNHDFYFGARRLIRSLHDATPLRFIGKKKLSFQEADGLTLSGLNDPMVAMTARHDYPELSELARDNHPDHFHVLLSHRPDIFEAAERHGYDLVLAGHTHGGQIVLPGRNGRGYNISQFATPYDKGLFIRNRTKLYVSRGVGYTGIPLRMGCPPEIALFTLRAA